MSAVGDWLRSLAQNDYMIDGHYLDDGKRLMDLADALDYLLAGPADLPQPPAEPRLARPDGVC